MAKGSEQFSWKLFGTPKKACWQCKRLNLRVQDVAEHRVYYPGGVTQFLCRDCERENREQAIRENRRALGLQERT